MPTKISFNLNNDCASIYQLFKISADSKGIELIYEPDLNIIFSTYGDSVRLNQILTNLVGNAIKFTEKGKVVLRYKQIASTSKNCTIEFCIEDTGIGIASGEQGKIFEGFSQANKSISSNFGGTGLGLAISKKLIELQGGKLSMKSQLGVGSEFTFYLTFETIAYDSLSIKPNQSLNVKSDNLNGMKVLMAEDNNINVLVLRRFLEKWGVNYEVAANGKIAVQKIKETEFDLILMDIHMPEMDGEEATKIIRADANEKIKSIPIIALTANASVEIQHKLLANGFTNYISKPFNPDNLFKLLKKYYFQN